MKSVFYPDTIPIRDLTITDKILYSHLLLVALWDKENHEQSFDSDGQFYPQYYEFGGFVPLPYTEAEKVYERINISRQHYYISKKRLKECGLIIKTNCGEIIKLIVDVRSFIVLRTETGLSGLELIVYSYISDKDKRYGWVDKYHNAMAMELHLSSGVFLNVLTRLYSKGLVQRMRKGHQVLLRVKT